MSNAIVDTLSDINTRTKITVTNAARKLVLELREKELDSEKLALRIEVSEVKGVDYAYSLNFEFMEEADPTDVPFQVGDDLTVLIPDNDLTKLDGSTLTVSSKGGQEGLILRNPNRPNLMPNAVLDLNGTIEENVVEVLLKRINPSIAVHGGFAEFVRMDGQIVVLKLGGGCQGCGMASATITAGIERTLRECLPEIESVLDITDHTSGENPYFD